MRTALSAALSFEQEKTCMHYYLYLRKVSCDLHQFILLYLQLYIMNQNGIKMSWEEAGMQDTSTSTLLYLLVGNDNCKCHWQWGFLNAMAVP